MFTVETLRVIDQPGGPLKIAGFAVLLVILVYLLYCNIDHVLTTKAGKILKGIVFVTISAVFVFLLYNANYLKLYYNNQPLENITIDQEVSIISTVKSSSRQEMEDHLNNRLQEQEKQYIVDLNTNGKKYKLQITTEEKTVTTDQPNGSITQSYDYKTQNH